MDFASMMNYVVIPLGIYAVFITALLVRMHFQYLERVRRREVKLPIQIDPNSEQALLREKADEAFRLSQTIQKFVPRQFMEHFEQPAATQLELGHAVEDEVAILCCDIRGFTGMSERLTPQELMRFLNSYFLRMNGPIHQNNGFIDKFIGDAIMALFDHPEGTGADKARDALRAAIALQKSVTLYNVHRRNCEYDPVSIGVGLHFGSVIIGTVGSDDRMDTTVLGDNVNVAFRLEALSPKYKAGIIVSEQLLDIAGYGVEISARVLDFVRVKGRLKPVKIYEVLDALSEAERKSKLAIKDDIEQGLKCRMAKKWDEALGHFQKALDTSPDDPIIVHHIEMCYRCQKMVLPDDWDGAMVSPV